MHVLKFILLLSIKMIFKKIVYYFWLLIINKGKFSLEKMGCINFKISDPEIIKDPYDCNEPGLNLFGCVSVFKQQTRCRWYRGQC